MATEPAQVTTLLTFRGHKRHELSVIPVVSKVFLSPDSTRLLLVGEDFEASLPSYWESYCFGAMEMLDLSGEIPSSRFVIRRYPILGFAKNAPKKVQKVRGAGWEGGEAPKGFRKEDMCGLKRFPEDISDPTLHGSVEEVWSTPEGGLLLRLLLRKEVGRSSKFLGTYYLHI